MQLLIYHLFYIKEAIAASLFIPFVVLFEDIAHQTWCVPDITNIKGIFSDVKAK